MTFDEIANRVAFLEKNKSDTPISALEAIKEIRSLSNDMKAHERSDEWYQLMERINVLEDAFIPF